MIRMDIRVKANTKKLRDLRARAAPEIRAVLEEDIKISEADAKARARVDTGDMRDKIEGRMVGPYIAELVGKAPHTIFNEFGTSKMSAQPMLTPALEAARQRLPPKIAKVFNP